MGDWSLLEGQLVDTVGEVAASSYGTTVTSHATANTKGSWTQIVAATTYAADGIFVSITCPVPVNYLVDIGIGAEGSEQVLIANLHTTIQSYVPRNYFYFLPISIPAGTRISARSQTTTGNRACYITINLLSQGFLPSAPLHRATTYGADLTDSGGVSVNPGASINTKGAYSQIVEATTSPIRALLVALGNFPPATCYWLLDVAVGAAGSEIVILPDLALCFEAVSMHFSPVVLGPFFIDIPAGTRLAVRSQCSSASKTFDVILYGAD